MILRQVRVVYLCLIICLLYPFLSNILAFEGEVVGVTDGDTITVLHDYVPEKIRLNGIDCPESGQPFGNKAKQFVSEKAFGKQATVIDYGKDKYGRTLGDVLVEDGTDINTELVKVGLAWWYREYSKDATLERFESEAKAAKRGLWSEPDPVAPWDWRHNPRTRRKTEQKKTARTISATDGEIVYVTKTGHKYHVEGCRYLKSSIPMELSAAAAHYAPCSVCGPPLFSGRPPAPASQGVDYTPLPTTVLPVADATNVVQDVTVFVTKSGSKYHRAGCRYLKSCIPMSLQKAKKHYAPCSVCGPPF
jgi:micrococcal nuclease